MNEQETIDEIMLAISEYHSGNADEARLIAKAAYAIAREGLEPKWLPIESAPKNQQLMLVWNKDYEYGSGVSYYSDVYEMFMIGSNRPQPTHWMPLPQPPNFAKQTLEEITKGEER